MTIIPSPVSGPTLGWPGWLQVSVNVAQLVELCAFLFGAYQVWSNRRERQQADIEAEKRARIDANYQAWQVINSAQGKGGSGGRVEALADLLRNDVSLAGVNLEGAWLERVALPGAILVRANLRGANLLGANFAGAKLEGADLRDTNLTGANLANADLRGALLEGARLSAATLDGADLREVVGWREIRALGHASIEGLHNAPAGFVELARALGASDGAEGLPDDTAGYSTHFRAL